MNCILLLNQRSPIPSLIKTMNSCQTYSTQNSATVEVLRSQLSALGLDPRGHKNVLQRRLRRYLTSATRDPWKKNNSIPSTRDVDDPKHTSNSCKKYEIALSSSNHPVNHSSLLMTALSASNPPVN